MTPKQFFFVTLGMAGLLVAVSGGGYYLAVRHIKNTSSQLATQLGERDAAEEQLQTLGRLEVQFNRDIKPILPLIDEALPRAKNQTEILAQLREVAGAAGLNLGAVSFQSATGLPGVTSQTVKTGDVLALPISFQVQGSFAQLQSFLSKVENLSRFTNVTTLSVSRPDKSKPITYSMTINAYVKP